jgi:large repetitive protein
MNNKLYQRTLFVAFLFLINFLATITAKGQMRQVYLDTDPQNEIKKMSFYTASEGYIATTKWIGYTIDSGRTVTKKFITLSNVNYNGYSVNLTFGFGINGVKAFNQNTFIVYGDYGFVPAILYTTNGGTSYTLIFQSQFAFVPNSSIEDMIFPQNGNVGYAVDFDRILKTTNGGLTWSVIRIDAGSDFNHLESIDDNNLIAMSTKYATNKLLKTSNGGTSWQTVSLPTIPNGKIYYAYFLTASVGWVNMQDNNQNQYLYKTINGGTSWSLINDIVTTAFACSKFKFVDNNVGYALYGFTILKTTNGGAVWEPLPRDNNYSYLGYGHNDLYILNTNQLWAGGGHGFLELSTNGGGTPLPKAFFKIDDTNVSSSGTVNLVNYSNSNHSFKWYKNDTLISTSYSTSYTHNLYKLKDTIKLVVTNGNKRDSLIKYINFPLPIFINSFSPSTGINGTVVTILGNNLLGVTQVFFGNTQAASFTIISPTQIDAVVGQGGSGSVKIINSIRRDSLAGFSYTGIQITSFTPTSASIGNTVTISGSNFIGTTNVSFGVTPAASFAVVNSSTITAVVGPGTSGSVTAGRIYDYSVLPGFNYSGPSSITSFNPSVTGPRAVVTITGINLIGTTAVSFGGTPAQSFSVVSATTILATVNSIGSTGNVSITTPAGTATLGGFVFTPLPTITSFFPTKADVGSSVTIRGTNFRLNPINNFVYFGSVPATVTAASDTQLIVTVPYGATFSPISVTCNNLVATTSKPFILTFQGGGNTIPTNSFAQKIDFSTLNNPEALFYDFDGDGKSDMITIDKYDNRFAVSKNTSTNDSISFGPPLNFLSSNFGPYISIKVVDMDGDGKLDMIVRLTGTNYGESTTYSYKNISLNGNIAFAPRVSQFYVSGDNNGVNTDPFFYNDFDNDGKIDLLIWHPNLSAPERLYFYRNTSFNGDISFAPAQIIYVASAGEVVSSMRLDDINGDNKPDIIFTQNSISGYVNVVRNTTINGNISFAPKESFNTNEDGLHGTEVLDVDGDGKLDLILNSYFHRFIVLRNLSTLTTVLFSPKIIYSLTNNGNLTYANSITCGDIDGDSKADIVLSTVGQLYNDPGYIKIYKNTSSSGNILLTSSLDIPVGNQPGKISIEDLNGDGKPELAFGNGLPNAVSILKNRIGGYSINLCPNTNTSITSDVSGSIYQWQLDSGAGFGNIVNNLNFTGTNNRILQINNIPASWNGYKFKCIISSSISSSISILQVSSQSNAGNDTSVCIGSSIQLQGLGGITYLWTPTIGLNNPNISNPNATPNLTTTYILKVINSNNCISYDTMQVIVNQLTAPSININATNNTVILGQSFSIISSITNGGSNPIYQWQDSTTLHTWANISGATNASLTYTPTAVSIGNKVRCFMTSNSTCALSLNATSNILSFVVTPSIVAPNPNGEIVLKYYPNPVRTILTIDSLKANDQWESFSVMAANGSASIANNNIIGKTKVTINVENLSAGMYLIVVRRKEGSPAYLKFIKQ